MSLSDDVLALLVCPENRTPLALAPAAMLERLNADIRARVIIDRKGRSVNEQLDEALVREDGQVLYAVRDGVPQLIVDEQIPVQQLSAEGSAGRR